MNEAVLYRRLLDFQFDEPGTELTFTARLARENGWSRRYAERVIDEYKKFAFLSVVAEHVVCPSEDVDEAWHLHLTYTRSYWHSFCALLGRPLHHHPTKGGPTELAKHKHWYEQTLASYGQWFGGDPPRAIWPPAEQRFHIARGHRRVDLNEHWVIPKLRLRLREALVMAAGAAAPAAGFVLNPFNYDGPTFLWLYLTVVALSVLAAILWRRSLRAGNDDAVQRKTEVDPYEAAYLAGGERLAIRAALATLVHEGALKVPIDQSKVLGVLPGNKQFRLVAASPLSREPAALERAIYDAAIGDGRSVREVQQAAEASTGRLADELERQGLLLDAGQSAKARWWPVLMVAGVALFGAIKIAVGLSRDRPVAFLVMAVIATLVTAAFFLRDASRTRAADRLLADLRRRHSRLNVRAAGVAPSLPVADVPLAIALFGMPVLAGGPLDDLRAALRAPPNQGGDGWTSGCGTGCGGGGCGGGGCGGGCGGCS